MPDFAVSITDTTVEPWTDPPFGARPSRLNPVANRPHLRRRAEPGVELTISARVAGVTAPLDAALGGRLFTGWLAEYPGGSPPAVTSPAGQSSVRRFTPVAPGHYTFVLSRDGRGAVILHVDVVGS